MKISSYAAVLGLLFVFPVHAMSYREAFPGRATQPSQAQEILDKLDYRHGPIRLPGTPATLNVPASFYYLNAADARTVLVDLWGNPPFAVEGVLGLVFPAKYDLVDERNWSSVVKYNADGYVSDTDAQTIDYDELLQQLKAASVKSNEERKEKGFDQMLLVGWASPPYYDARNHALHWARDLLSGDPKNDFHALNYSVRILGRDGVFELNFVSGLTQLAEIKNAIPAVTQFVQFDEGKEYKDYAAGDKLAAYGMAGMIAAGAGAKIAAKVGFLAIALGFLKKGAILVVVAIGGLVRFAKGLFRRDNPPAA